MHNRCSVWFFPLLCVTSTAFQTTWTQLIKLNFCVSIFLALVTTELPLIPNDFNIFSLRFTVLYPLVFRYFFSVAITLFIVFISFFHPFFLFFFSSTPPQFIFLTIRIFHLSSVRFFNPFCKVSSINPKCVKSKNSMNMTIKIYLMPWF